MSTIKDVARMADVSIATVSKFLNGGTVREENAAAIRHAIAVLDYRVNPFARSLKTQRSRSIGILIPDLTAPFYGSFLSGLDKVLREYGYHSLVSCYSANHGTERDNLQFLISTGIDGLVYAPEDLTPDEFYELTANCNIPVVQFDRMIQGVASDTVLVENTDIVYEAVSQLIERGHRRIGLLSGMKSVFTAKERQIGYLRALSDHGILYDDELVVSGQHIFATGYHGCEQLLQLSEPPSAIITTNHDITIGAFTALRDLGVRTPDDIDLIGFDCVDVCTMMKPPLPVIRQPEAELGQLAGEYLIERMQGYTGEARVTRLPCKLLQP